MRLLLLGNSSDVMRIDDPAGPVFQRLCAGLETLAGASVEGRYVYLFPSTRAARYARRQIDNFDPDVIALHCSGASVGPVVLSELARLPGDGRLYQHYLTLQLRLQQALGVAGPTAERGGSGVAREVYYTARNALLRAGAGRPIAGVEAAAAAYRAVIDGIASREDVPFIVRGPTTFGGRELPPRLQRAALARVQALDERVAEICHRRRVPFYSLHALTMPEKSRYYDSVHTRPNAACHELMAAQELRLLLPLLTDRYR